MASDKSGVHAIDNNIYTAAIYTMLHLPILMAMLLAGLVAEEAIKGLTLAPRNRYPSCRSGTKITLTFRWMFCGCITLVISGFVGLQMCHKGSGKGVRVLGKGARSTARIICGAIVLCFAFIPADRLPAYGLLLLVTGVQFGLVVVEAIGRQVRNDPRWEVACPATGVPGEKPEDEIEVTTLRGDDVDDSVLALLIPREANKTPTSIPTTPTHAL